MTASLPSEVQAVLAQFTKAELTTVDGEGQPITWPVTVWYRPGAPCIDLSPDVHHPQKADHARANPLVALLFSDPEGSGLSDPPMVLVQGSAQVEDRPGGGAGIHVRPERVYVWPRADVTAEPTLYDAHLEEVRSGHSEEPERFHAAPAGGASTWSPRIADLQGAGHPTGVLSIIAPDGFPFAVRVPVQIDAAARWVVIGGAPTGIPFQPGLGCLTASGSLQVRGDLVYVEDAWALLPHEVEELNAQRTGIGQD